MKTSKLRWIILAAALIVASVMGYFLKVPLSSEEGHPAPAQLASYVATLKEGSPAERKAALVKLIGADAEDLLAGCLGSDDEMTISLATHGLWECWLNEKGPDARRRMDEGVIVMNAGNLVGAEEIFRGLMEKYPDWAEAINKQATVLYLMERPAESLALCKKVVALKPNHFGAWNGMALCAVQLKDWITARKAAREAVRIQPRSEQNRRLLKSIEANITDV